MVVFDEDKQRQRISELRRHEEENFTKIIAARKGVRYADLGRIPIDLDALRLIPEADARAAAVVAFGLQNKTVQVGVPAEETAKTEELLAALRDRGFELITFMVSRSALEKAYTHYKDLSFALELKAGSIDISNEQIAALIAEVKTTDDIKGRIDTILAEKKSYKISRVIEIILGGALALDVSDVHIEPEESGAVLRYRLDGVLHVILHFDKETYDLIINRIKLLSGLKINVRNLAQDGRFSVSVQDAVIDLRVSTLPGSYGESSVLRVLNPKNIQVTIEEMGVEPGLLAVIDKEISKPNGMILTTGPTGSGKTTTLYAFLRKVYSTEMKIITIENPVEYHLAGIVQSQTDAARGFTFLQGLRAAVRQDPDIIMVGEIRDEETAQTAVDAALTGHLVFSTLHTNSAAGAFTRLIDLKINPKVITSALNLSIAQRLARKLCAKCKKEIAPTENDKRLLEGILATIKNRDCPKVVEKLWTAPGCIACSNTGFRGRIGIFEAIRSDAAVEALVVNNPSEREIRKAAENQGMLSLRQDGALKILAGITSVDEVNRVIDLASEM